MRWSGIWVPERGVYPSNAPGCGPFGTVYAVEYKPAALEILEKNKAFLQTENLQIIPGRAEEQIGSLPVPDCVFLGGSDGAAPELIEHLCQLKQPGASCGKRSDPGNPGGTVSAAAKAAAV